MGKGRGGSSSSSSSVLKRVRGPKITEDSWKSAHVGEGGREKEEDRSNEADSLFSVFSASAGIGRLSGARARGPSSFFFFFFFVLSFSFLLFCFLSFLFFFFSSVLVSLVFHRHLLPPPCSPRTVRLRSRRRRSLFLPFKFPSRGIMRPSCRELVRLVPPFFLLLRSESRCPA